MMDILQFSRKFILLLTAVVFLAATGSCSADYTRKELNIFAGAAARPALEEALTVFEENRNININVTYGGTGTMLSRMQMSGRGDIFISGSPGYMKKAKKNGLVFPKTTVKLAYLVPGILVPKNNDAGIEELADLAAGETRVGLANPESVVIGRYGLEILEHNNLTEQILANTVTLSGSLSAVNTLVINQQVDGAIGFRISENWNPEKIKHIPLAPEQLPRISYLAGSVSKNTIQKQTAEKFLDFLTSERGREIFRTRGYLVDQKEVLTRTARGQVGGSFEISGDYHRLIDNRE